MQLPKDHKPNYEGDKFANMVTFISVMLVSIAFDSAIIFRQGWKWEVLWILPVAMTLAFWKVQTRTTPGKEGRFLIKRDFPL